MHGYGKWQVQINRSLDRFGGDVLIFRHDLSARKSELLRINENGVCFGEEVVQYQGISHPTFRIDNEQELREIIAAFIELGKELGTRAPDESHNAGKLEATERHLDDMRKLVFPEVVNTWVPTRAKKS